MKEELEPPATLANAGGFSMHIFHRFGGRAVDWGCLCGWLGCKGEFKRRYIKYRTH